MPISRKALLDAVMARLESEVVGVAVYRGMVDGAAATVVGSNGRVRRYVTLWPSPGTPGTENDLGDSIVDVDWLIQVTCVAAEVDDTLQTAGDVHQVLFRWAPVITGVVTGGFRVPPGYDPGPIRVDTDMTPARYYLPLQFTCTANL